MAKKRSTVQKTKVIQTKDQTGSPYWNWLDKTVYRRSKGESSVEPVQANPDSLSEADGIYAISEEQNTVNELVRQLINLAPQFLTEKQSVVFSGIGEGKTIALISREMGLQDSTVREHWEAAQRKLQKKFRELQEADRG